MSSIQNAPEMFFFLINLELATVLLDCRNEKLGTVLTGELL